MQKTLGKLQIDEMNAYMNMKPADRKENIMHHLKEIGHNQCATIEAFGLKLDNNLMHTPARQLDAPLVEYRDRKTIKPKNGGWSMKFGVDELQVVSTSTNDRFKWTILNTVPDIANIKLKQFAKGV